MEAYKQFTVSALMRFMLVCGLVASCNLQPYVLEWVMLFQLGFLASQQQKNFFITRDDLIDFTICTKWEWKRKIECITAIWHWYSAAAAGRYE